MTRIRRLAGVGLVLLLSASAWGQTKTVKIGFVNHLTGDAAVYGQSMKKGTDLALDEINAAWAKKKMQLEVVFEDDRLAAADAQTAFLKLVQSDKVPVVMGSGSSTVTLSLCPKAQEAKVVLISSISTAPGLKKCGAYFFGMMATDDAAGVEWSHLAKKLGHKQAAVMYINNDYGIGVKDGFVAAFKKAGGKVLIEQGHEVGGTDFRAEVLKVKATNPKVVFIVSHVKEGSLILKQAKELGLQAQWIGDTALQTKEVPELAGAGAEGFIALSPGDKSTAVYKSFAEKFQKKFGSEPTIWADFAYDTTMVVARALEAGAMMGEALQKKIKDVAKGYKGPSGPKALNQFNIVAEYYEAYQVKDGKWVPWTK
ncbi:MAG: ABC transporter substrate-binding protein [Candidatus Rokubacteria bacterium]|nr:ABC transporter substrate-binding protein [Candidatus Rokubacteria bacterium]